MSESISLFLTPDEKQAFGAFCKEHRLGLDLYWALVNRTEARAASPGLHGPDGGSAWWFCAAEYLTDAAMVHALKPSEALEVWLREVTLSIVRRPEDDWVGPPFRNHHLHPPVGHLETAHLSWGVAVVLDLAREIFSPEEIDEIESCLRERAIPMCRRWLESHFHMANWRCVLGAGVAVAAAVLGDWQTMEWMAEQYRISTGIFQPDGTYAESLQYANYAAYTLMLTREALVRADPAAEGNLSLAPWIGMVRWQAVSLFYRKPLSGFGSVPRPRCANFNDSGALFRPSGDLCLFFAARGEAHPSEAGLARWLFDTLYGEDLSAPPHDRATFGFLNDFGFLSVPLIFRAAPSISPVEAPLPRVQAFSCGDVLVRDQWGGKTILAVHGGGDPLRGPGHLHGDLNSFILTHENERLLVDPGHSCYRGLVHAIEVRTTTHNTCSFEVSPSEEPGLQEEQHRVEFLEQKMSGKVFHNPETGAIGPPFDRGAQSLLATESEEVRVVGSEASGLYGEAMEEFSRFWILCGSHACFVLDRIRSRRPSKVNWHFLLNNRDGRLDLKWAGDDRLVARRGRVGMKLFHLGGGSRVTDQHAFVHDAYHPEPGQLGEGASGSGRLIRWRERQSATARVAIHAIAIDSYGRVAGWHLGKESTASNASLEGPEKSVRWRLSGEDAGDGFRLEEELSKRTWSLRLIDGNWTFARA